VYEITPSGITTERILSKFSQEELWEYYLGFPVEEGKIFLSPLRDEDNPSANLFYATNGNLLLKDFGFKTVNIWQYVMYIYNLTFREAVVKVAEDLGLHTSIKADIPASKKTPKKRDRVSIEIRVKRWNEETFKYWNEYYITKETLRLYNTVPIDRLWLSGEYLPIKQPAYSYEFGKGYRKVYLPFSDKMRFISNVPGYMYSGYEQLPWVEDLLIITKSHKDVMVWYELGYHAISPQGEGHKIEHEFLMMLLKRFKKIILNYDNDRAGKLYSNQLANAYKLPELFIPESKDISDYIKEFGKEQSLNNSKIWLDTLLK
jgi:hypothetical protein